MRTALGAWQRMLARLRRFDRPRSTTDRALSVLTDEFEANDRMLRDLLERDGRDTGDVPGFDGLADRQAELVELICATPARNHAGVVAKARCARLRPSEQGFDAAQALALSASDDLLRLVGAAGLPLEKKGPDMTGRTDADLRSAILRRNNGWRQLSITLSQIGVWSLCGAGALPFYGVSLPWFVLVALGAVGVGTICLSFFVLRFIDRPE